VWARAVHNSSTFLADTAPDNAAVTAPADGSPTPLPAREPEPPLPPEAVPDVHPTLAASASSDNCPSCGRPLASDQRYCLECGHRRGDPRLPFMDAVVFMEAINKPQATVAASAPSGGSKPRGLSANSALIAGIATLVLAIGVGVLIGRSGDSGTSSAANQAPQIIRVGGGEAEESSASEEDSAKNSSKAKGGKEKKANNATAKKAEAKTETGNSGQTKATEEVLEPKVPQAKPEATVGETCDKGTAGCSDSGKFEGNFFGE
jgi:hypothetical protein